MVDHLGSSDEQYRKSLLAAGISQRSCKVSLAGACVSSENGRRQVIPFDTCQKFQVRLLDFLGGFRVSKVKILHCLEPAEFRASDSILDHLRIALRFFLGDPLSEVF